MDEAWELWNRDAWTFADARDRLDQILDLAARQQPQRIRRGDREAVVLDADAYRALADAADQALPPPPVQRDVCTCSGRTLLGALRDSPWRDALEGGDWPWAWNWLTAEWSHLGPIPPVGPEARPLTDPAVQTVPRKRKALGENAPAPSANGSHPPDRKWVWEWDEESQCYALPWAKDVDPAEYPGLPFLNAMQNSPLAEALRTGEILEEDWRALFDRGGE